MPESSTSIRTVSSRANTETPTDPLAGVNFIAFERRLSST